MNVEAFSFVAQSSILIFNNKRSKVSKENFLKASRDTGSVTSVVVSALQSFFYEFLPSFSHFSKNSEELHSFHCLFRTTSPLLLSVLTVNNPGR